MTADAGTDSELDLKGGRRRVSRARGALSGGLLVVLGAWAALAPFIGPYFDFAYTPEAKTAFHWTAGRAWYEVLPGAVAVLGGLLLLASASRLATLLGGWLAALAGSWLVVGPSLAEVLNLGGIGAPASSTQGVRALESLLFFFGTGVVIVFVASVALGRLSVHSVRDVRAAERRAESDAQTERLERERLEQQRLEQDRLEQRHRDDEQRRSAETPHAAETRHAAGPDSTVRQTPAHPGHEVPAHRAPDGESVQTAPPGEHPIRTDMAPPPPPGNPPPTGPPPRT